MGSMQNSTVSFVPLARSLTKNISFSNQKGFFFFFSLLRLGMLSTFKILHPCSFCFLGGRNFGEGRIWIKDLRLIDV